MANGNYRGRPVSELENSIQLARQELIKLRERARTVDREIRMLENSLRELNITPVEEEDNAPKTTDRDS